MEGGWINEEKIDPQDASRVAEGAVIHAQSLSTPAHDSLEDDYKQYGEERFPKTNDDTLREDFAQKVVIEGYDGIDEIRKSQEKSESVQETIRQDMEGMSSEIESTRRQHEVESKNKEFFVGRVKQLKDEIRILELSTELNPRFSLQKSGISNEQIASLALHEIEVIKKVIESLERDIAREDSSLENLQKQYDAIVEKYTELYKMRYPENPQLN